MENQNIVLSPETFPTSKFSTDADSMVEREAEKFEKLLPKDAKDYDTLPKNYRTLARKAAGRLERLGKKAQAYYGDVPVFYGGHRPKDSYAEPSILEQINTAKTADEVVEVLKKGLEFKGASPKTIKKWREAATISAKRIADATQVESA